MSTFVIGMTGASGSIYGITLIRELAALGHRLYVTLTKEARFILKDEMGMEWSGEADDIQRILLKTFPGSDIRYCMETDLTAPIASGSVLTDGMVIVPCSMKTVAAVANGFSANLIERAADVSLKEGRRLIIVPRETPLGEVHLQNLLTLARMRVKVLAAMPAFYQHPKSIEDMVNFIVGRVLDGLGIQHKLFRRWGD